jgi:hypothetical protein
VFRWSMPPSLYQLAKWCAAVSFRLVLVVLAASVLVTGLVLVMPVVWLVRRLQASPTDA